MNEIASPTARAPLWSRIWHFLCAIDEAAHITEIDVILLRLDRLERAVRELREPQGPVTRGQVKPLSVSRRAR